MKRRWLPALIILAFVYMLTLSSAKIIVHDSDVKKEYNAGDFLLGTINLTLEDVAVDAPLTSNKGNSLQIIHFLMANSANFSCSVAGCQTSFTKSGRSESKQVSVSPNKTGYAGIYLKGTQVEVKGISFKIKSDFASSDKAPLTIDFFGEENWTFNKFGDEYSPRNYGCYNPAKGKPGPKLRKAKYCELIDISETAAVLAGVDVTGTDTKNLQMVIHPFEGGGELASCNYNPSSAQGCILTRSAGSIFPKGTYQFCVEENAFTNYTVLSESEPNTCGFAFEFGPKSSESDFAIHAQTAKYANASSFNESLLGLSGLHKAANNYIETAYNKDCSAGCILPFTFIGDSQTLGLDNLELNYKSKGLALVENDWYTLEKIPVTLDFSGVLELKLAEFGVTTGGAYTLFLEGVKLINVILDNIQSPTVEDIYPRTVPAGVPVELRAVTQRSSQDLKYQWNLGGNESSVITKEPAITHIFPKIKTYTVQVHTISNQGPSEKKSFTINAISPKDAINETITTKKQELKAIEELVSGAPTWYRSKLEAMTNISFYTAELDKLDKAAKSFSNSSSITGVATTLYKLTTPTKLHFAIEPNIELLSEASQIDPTPVALLNFGKDFRGASKYSEAVARWQENNIVPRISANQYKVALSSGEEAQSLSAYTVQIHSFLGEPGYLVIDRPKAELTFKEGISALESGDYTLVELKGSTPQTIEFYATGPKETLFYTSPVLTNVLLEGDINVNCNNNNICEKDQGETTKTCRNDCKPTTSAAVYLILVILAALVIYTLLQIWYKRNYEKYLFKDRAHLYNLLMFITNARAREKHDKEIVQGLGASGWSHERIVYAMKKSRGERTGMFEIIPVEKIASYFRNRKARKAVKQLNTEVKPPQMPRAPPQRPVGQGNINKQQGFRRSRVP